MPEPRPFNITDYLPAVTIDYLAGSWAPTGQTEYVAQPLDGGPDGFLYQSQIDLAGWTKDGLTAFFTDQYIQRDGPYTAVVPVPFTVADIAAGWDIIIVSDVPLPPSTTMNHAGFTDNPSDFMNIKFASGMVFIQSSTSPTIMINADGWLFSSGQPTASGTLYISRLVIPDKPLPTVADFISFPALRYVAQGITTEESEHVHLTRLRRSYEQQSRQ